MIEIEICIPADEKQAMVADLQAAIAGGAARIELCAAMADEGLSPSPVLTQAAQSVVANQAELLIMLRPRAGDFIYSQREVAAMEKQLLEAAATGVQGVVFGMLTNESHIDVPSTARLTKLAHREGLKVTFHRAFDATRNPFEALTVLASEGVERVLTAGIPWGESGGALDGLAQLRSLATQSSLEIVIGGGVSPENAREIVLGVEPAGSPLSLHAYSGVRVNHVTDADRVQQLVRAASIKQS